MRVYAKSLYKRLCKESQKVSTKNVYEEEIRARRNREEAKHANLCRALRAEMPLSVDSLNGAGFPANKRQKKANPRRRVGIGRTRRL
jgi:hypothetical protein